MFIPDIKEHLESQNVLQKAVLMIDNVPSHAGKLKLKYEDGNIFVKFPHPVTALSSLWSKA